MQSPLWASRSETGGVLIWRRFPRHLVTTSQSGAGGAGGPYWDSRRFHFLWQSLRRYFSCRVKIFLVAEFEKIFLQILAPLHLSQDLLRRHSHPTHCCQQHGRLYSIFFILSIELVDHYPPQTLQGDLNKWITPNLSNSTSIIKHMQEIRPPYLSLRANIEDDRPKFKCVTFYPYRCFDPPCRAGANNKYHRITHHNNIKSQR